LSDNIGKSFLSSNREIRRIQAETANDQIALADLQMEKVRTDAEQEARDKIANAQKAGAVGVELTTARIEAESVARDKIRVGEAALAADRIKIWRDQIDFLDSVLKASADAASTRASAEAQASGSVLAVWADERQKALAGIAQETAQRKADLDK